MIVDRFKILLTKTWLIKMMMAQSTLRWTNP